MLLCLHGAFIGIESVASGFAFRLLYIRTQWNLFGKYLCVCVQMLIQTNVCFMLFQIFLSYDSMLCFAWKSSLFCPDLIVIRTIHLIGNYLHGARTKMHLLQVDCKLHFVDIILSQIIIIYTQSMSTNWSFYVIWAHARILYGNWHWFNKKYCFP